MRSSVCCAVTIILCRDLSNNNSLDQAKQVPHITTALLADEHCRVLTVSRQAAELRRRVNIFESNDGTAISFTTASSFY